MATGTSDDERDDDLNRSTEPTADEVSAADETADEVAAGTREPAEPADAELADAEVAEPVVPADSDAAGEVEAEPVDAAEDAAATDATDAKDSAPDDDADNDAELEVVAAGAGSGAGASTAAASGGKKKPKKAPKSDVVATGKREKPGAKSTTGKAVDKTKPGKKPADKGERGGIGKFFTEVGNELRKVVTPTRHELWRYVGVVVAFLLIMMLLVIILDWIFGFVSSWVFGHGSSLLPPEWFQGNPTETPLPSETPLPAESVPAAPAATP